MSAAAGDAAGSADGGGTAAAAAPESVRMPEPSSGALNLSVALRDVADLGLQATLRGFDKDDSGTVDLVELRAAAEVMRRTRAQGQVLKKVVLVLAVLLLVSVGINAALTFAVIEAAKELEVGWDDVLQVKGRKGSWSPVATASAVREVDVFELPSMRHEELSAMQEMILPYPAGSVAAHMITHRIVGVETIVGLSKKRATSAVQKTVVLRTALGEQIVVSDGSWQVKDQAGKVLATSTALGGADPERRKLNQALDLGLSGSAGVAFISGRSKRPS